MSREKFDELVVLAEKLESEFLVIPKGPEDNIVANAVSRLVNYQYGEYAKSVKWASRRLRQLEEAVDWVLEQGDLVEVEEIYEELRRRAGKEEGKEIKYGDDYLPPLKYKPEVDHDFD